MLSEEIIEKLTERLVKRIESGNTFALKKIGANIKQFKTIKVEDAQKLANILKYGGSYNEIVKELAKITDLNVKDIYKIFEEVAKKDYQFAKQFYDYRGVDYIPYEQNIALQIQVNALARITANEYVNIAGTKALGFGMIDKKGNVVYKGLQKAYYDLIDEAVLNISQGKETFDGAMFRQLKEIGNGMKVISPTTYMKKIIDEDGNIDYVETNRTMRADSALRMNMQGALRDLHNETQKIIGEQYGADGVEISVHSNPALDHENAQGKQFSYEEYKKLQEKGRATTYDGKKIDMHIKNKNGNTQVSFRPISKYNCNHWEFEIVLGVNKPEYTDEQLQKIIDDNEKGFEINGKHYTMYEGTQMQRKLETAIRKEKDTQIMAKASGNEQLIAESQSNITKLTNKYNELCKVSGLQRKADRLRVSGYKRTKVQRKNNKEIEYARRNNKIWHSTENLEEIIESDKLISPSLAVSKELNSKVRYGTQFIEFKPELLENVDKKTKIYIGDGGNKFSKENNKFDNLMEMLKNKPDNYNELKFNNNLKSLEYIKKVYIRQDESKKVIELLEKNNINYEIYHDYRERGFKKKR